MMTARRIFALVLALAIVLTSSPATHAEQLLRREDARAFDDPEPVKVVVLTESLCPFCEKLEQSKLPETYEQLGPTVMDLKVIPFGNAVVTDKESQTVQCQHGLAECDANTYELCAIHAYPDPEEYLPYLQCLSTQLEPGYHNETFGEYPFRHCAIQCHLWWPVIQSCHDTNRTAWEVTWQAATDTPKHDYVPWIVINGKQMDPNKDLKSEICKAYAAQGGNHPECSDDDSNDKLAAQGPVGWLTRRFSQFY